MASAAPSSIPALQIRRTLRHSPERVFDAWTQAAALTRWFAPSDDFKTIVRALDARLGGHYTVEMQKPDGTIHVVTGRYTTFDRPTKLSFTWQWETNPDEGDTQVTIDLTPTADGCELVLTHDRFVAAADRDSHEQGWAGCLDRLATKLESL